MCDITLEMNMPRCPWCGSDPEYVAYHDLEWGYPVHEDKKLFEMLILDGFQAGLSWLTILKKRDHFRQAFCDWDAEKIAAFTATDLDRLLQDKGIIRNKLKIKAAVLNSVAFLEVQKEFGSFDRYIWQFTGGDTITPDPRPVNLTDIPSRSPESDAMSKDLKRHGFKFVGSTICYAFMQAAGMVDDHLATCFRARK
jgi:DNA-3-methyladenine glycosylase I